MTTTTTAAAAITTTIIIIQLFIYILKKGVGWIPLFYHCVVYLKVHLGPSVIIL